MREFLREKEEREATERQRAKEAAAAVPAAHKQDLTEWEPSGADQEILDRIRTVSDFVSERPEMSATVLRLWLRDQQPNQDGSKVGEPR